MAAITDCKLGTRFKVPGKLWAAGYHTGVDFLTPSGSPLKAPADSRIIHAGTGGWGAAYGIHVIGEGKGADGKTYRWITAHMSSVAVKKGQNVKVGANLGKSGATGNVTGPHVHFEVRTAPFGYYNHVNPNIILNVVPAAKIEKTPLVRYEVTAKGLNARSGPGTHYPVMTVRDRGFEFNSTHKSGKWVRAAKHWYHADYLKVVNAATPPLQKPTPKPEPLGTKWRFGTLNIPLDPEKLRDGAFRAKVAAEQIHAANLHFVSCQELDRRYPSDTWHYARIMLHALREFDPSWKIIKPTTGLNENISFYRSTKAALNGIQSDMILTSNAGGRHCSRATLVSGDSRIKVRNTHLVEGKNNGAAREAQAEQIAKHADKYTVILGDFNQPEIPKALTKNYRSARTAAVASSTREYGTYAKMTATKAPVAPSGLIDHILVHKDAVVNGYTIVGIGKDGVLDQPRASDHLLVIVSVTFTSH